MWPFGGNKKPADLRLQKRKEAAASLQQYNPSITTLNPDAYQLAITTRFGQLICLIDLVPEFPEKPPDLRLQSSVSHPWVNTDMHVVGHPKLGVNWSIHHNLGQIVRDVYHEFSRNPPAPFTPGLSREQPLIPSPSVLTPSLPVPSFTLPGVDRQLTPSLVPNVPPTFSVPPPSTQMEIAKTPEPPVPDKFVELDRLTLEELERLLNNPDLLQTMAENQESSLGLRAAYDDVIQTVESQASKNIAKRAEVQEGEAKLSSLRTEVERQQAQLDILERRQAEVSQKYSLMTVMQLLDDAIGAADEESERIKRRYENRADGDEAMGADTGPLDVNQFAAKFLKARTLYHKRAAKRERLFDVYVHGPALHRAPSQPMAF